DGGTPAKAGAGVSFPRGARRRRRGTADGAGAPEPVGDGAGLTPGARRGILPCALGRRLTVGPEILDLVVQVRILAPQPSSHPPPPQKAGVSVFFAAPFWYDRDGCHPQ